MLRMSISELPKRYALKKKSACTEILMRWRERAITVSVLSKLGDCFCVDIPLSFGGTSYIHTYIHIKMLTLLPQNHSSEELQFTSN